MYRIYDGKCCGQSRPTCLDIKPEFSWKLVSSGKGIKQKYYEITLRKASGEKVWDSGKIKGVETHNIPYNGPELLPEEDYCWQVKSRADNGEAAFSETYFFSTGILDIRQWKAKWIEPNFQRKPCRDETKGWKTFAGEIHYLDKPEEALNPPVYFRKGIYVKKKVKRAKLFITAHGIYQCCINGKMFGIPLAPGYTAYKRYQEYQAYDVTDALVEGENVLGVIVADGWYLGKVGLMGIGDQYGEQLALLSQLSIRYEDGSWEVIGSDRSWTAGTGAFLYADLYVGEGVDARREPEGWCIPGTDQKAWKNVIEKDYGYEHLMGSADEPPEYVRVQDPVRIFRSPNGELIVDAGENIAGFISLQGTAEECTPIHMEYSEVLDQSGNFLRNIMGQNKNQTDMYIPANRGEFFYRPSFTYHGFQYVRITGLRKEQIRSVQVYVLASNLEQTGAFECSDHRLNQLQSNIFRSQQGNMIYIPTDCPQREKAGWTGDMQVYAPTAAFLMDVEAFLRKWLANMRLEQKEDGQIPDVIPDIPSNRMISHNRKEECSSGWGDACVIVPFRLYMVYGDKNILKENYEMMLRWMDYVEHKALTEVPNGYENISEESREHQKYLWNTGFHYGDWLIPSLSRDGVAENPLMGAEMTKELTAPAMFAYTTELMTKICTILGENKKADHYKKLNEKIKGAYTHEYLLSDGTLKLNYQGIYVLALKMGLVPEKNRDKILFRLLEMIRENGGCLDTGFLSMPFLLDVLHENGCQEAAYQLLYQDKCPSWLYEIKMGANTIWESWNNISPDGKKNRSSYNHFAFGCVGDFIYRKILGIQCLEAGYNKVRIQPDLKCGLSWVKGSYNSIHGMIRVSWSSTDKKGILDVEIPPNVEANILFGNYTQWVGSGAHHFEMQ